MLWCSKCRTEKQPEAFSKKPGQSGFCRQCDSIRHKQAKLNNPALFSKRARAQTLRMKFGMTVPQYESRLAIQNGVCAICGAKQKRRHQCGSPCNLPVDHDHSTGFVRGLLCDMCNKGLGMFRDNPLLIRRAAEYLERFNALQALMNEAI
jgi:hypothetical protein